MPYLIIAFVFLLDQAHKAWLYYFYDIAEKAPVSFTPFMDIVLVWNRGISYGWFQLENMTGQYVLAAFKVIVACVLIYFLRKSKDKQERIGFALIAGGAFGNALDRIHYGAVMDMFAFKVEALNFYWYVFNIADIAIVFGVLMLIYHSIKAPKPTP